uniref:Nudix hydrolase 14 n=1 Tax=Crocodylus porosus TaxID=8502 RepID=A0A7M4FD14_CROPO
MRTHDSVSILIFNTSRQCFVVVKQFRPAVYMCEMERHQPQDFQHKDQECWYPVANPIPAASGVTYELCAGIVDKPELSLEEIACKEVLEECGYDVPIANLKRITSYRFCFDRCFPASSCPSGNVGSHHKNRQAILRPLGGARCEARRAYARTGRSHCSGLQRRLWKGGISHLAGLREQQQQPPPHFRSAQKKVF